MARRRGSASARSVSPGSCSRSFIAAPPLTFAAANVSEYFHWRSRGGPSRNQPEHGRRGARAGPDPESPDDDPGSGGWQLAQPAQVFQVQAMLLEEQLVGGEGGVGAWVDPHRVGSEDADRALLDQTALGLGTEARVVQPACGISVQVGRRVIPPVLEAGPHDDGGARPGGSGRSPPPSA